MPTYLASRCRTRRCERRRVRHVRVVAGHIERQHPSVFTVLRVVLAHEPLEPVPREVRALAGLARCVVVYPVPAHCRVEDEVVERPLEDPVPERDCDDVALLGVVDGEAPHRALDVCAVRKLVCESRHLGRRVEHEARHAALPHHSPAASLHCLPEALERHGVDGACRPSTSIGGGAVAAAVFGPLGHWTGTPCAGVCGGRRYASPLHAAVPVAIGSRAIAVVRVVVVHVAIGVHDERVVRVVAVRGPHPGVLGSISPGPRISNARHGSVGHLIHSMRRSSTSRNSRVRTNGGPACRGGGTSSSRRR